MTGHFSAELILCPISISCVVSRLPGPARLLLSGEIDKVFQFSLLILVILVRPGSDWGWSQLVSPVLDRAVSVMTSSDVMTTIYNHQSVICLLGKIMIILNTQITTIMLQMSYKHGIVMSSCTNWPNNLTIIIIKHSKIIFPSHKVSTICT